MNLLGVRAFYSRIIRSIPNALTISRLIAGLLFPFAGVGFRLPLLIYAGISDLIDGEISRRVGGSSRFGKLLDPIADKTVVLAVAITLLFDGTITWWELLLVASRDLFVIAISIGVLFQDLKQPMETSPLMIGKVATAAQFTYLVTLFLIPEAHWFVFVIAAAISLLAGVAYLYDAITQVRELSVRNLSPVDVRRE
jgi:phosphatidylglycerophosphate synthase